MRRPFYISLWKVQRPIAPMYNTNLVIARALLFVSFLILLVAPSSALADIEAREAPASSSSARHLPEQRSSSVISPRIVGGFLAAIDDYPWQVSINLNPAKYNGTPYQRHFCGGTLVTPTVIVSAAHCFYNTDNDSFYPADDHSVIAGRSTLSGSGGQEIAFARYFYFVDGGGQALYDSYTNDYDVVVAELEDPVLGAKPIKIAGPDERALWSAGRSAFASGWGATFEGGAQSDQLRAVGLSILQDSSCSVYDTYSNLQLCAGVPSGGRDTCQGDSGGPLVVPTAAGEYRLVGATSYGEGCARTGWPGVYARLAETPISSAIVNLFSQYGFGAALGSGAQPPSGPETTLTAFPRRVEVLPRRASSKRLVFRFISSEPSATFRCTLSRNGSIISNRSCSSPFIRFYRTGSYKLQVRSQTSQAQELVPASYSFRVRR